MVFNDWEKGRRDREGGREEDRKGGTDRYVLSIERRKW